MLLLEADGKELLRSAGIATPAGVRWSPAGVRWSPAGVRWSPAADRPGLPGDGPWIVKAQVPVGGRGKAGGIRKVEAAGEAFVAASEMVGRAIKGCPTREVLIEQAVDGEERYLSFMVDAGHGGIRILYAAAGGVDIESTLPGAEGSFDALVELDASAIDDAVTRLAALAPPREREPLRALAAKVARLFVEERLLLVEINPLFALGSGELVAGDAKVVVDMNVVPSRPLLSALFDRGRTLYPDAWRKLAEDFDFVVIEPDGQVGLVTTGAGLSMMVIDELVGRGLRPFNFCDMRTGQMRGSPARLLRIFDWLAEAKDVRVVLVNIFAGITDLGEFARLLVEALDQRPGFRLPVVARLVGNGEQAARELLQGRPDLALTLEPDLEKAIALAGRLAAGGTHAP